jgi:hypothetical protein
MKITDKIRAMVFAGIFLLVAAMFAAEIGVNLENTVLKAIGVGIFVWGIFLLVAAIILGYSLDIRR